MSEDPRTIRIYYDDNAEDIIDKLNVLLRAQFNVTFDYYNGSDDGWVEYKLLASK